MKIVAALIAALLLNGSAFAHSHDEFPEGALLALEGKDAITKEECFLFVMDVQYSGAEKRADQFSAKVLTSYSHDHDAPAPIEVRVNAKSPNILVGTGSNGQDQIAIFLDQSAVDLRNAKYFNLKWLHGNHFHTNRCVDLRPHQH